MDFFGIGGNELIVIVLLAVIVLGPRRVAESARELGRLIRNLKNYFKELTGDLNRELDVLADLKEVSQDIHKR
jgi:sec-independent protein translocase protein TatB